MAQPMTVIATPEPDDAGCPEGVNFCSGVCREYNDGYHSGEFTFMKIKRWARGRYRKAMLSVSVYREATKNGKIGKPKVTLFTDDFGEQVSMSPTRARMLSAHLANAADQADPIPFGAVVVAACAVRIGDEILTSDGWQNVVGQMAFADQANVWTDGTDRDPETDGWKFDPADPVKVRRPLHGGDADLNNLSQITVSALGWCSRCKADRIITGSRTISARGVIRARGRCQTCNNPRQCAFVGLTDWAEDAR